MGERLAYCFLAALCTVFFCGIFAFCFPAYIEARKLAKIKFKDFLQFYELNPKRWELDDAYVKCRLERRMPNGERGKKCYCFSFIDYLKYRAWTRRNDKREFNEERMRDMADLLDTVRFDTENAKASAKKTVDEAIEELLDILQKNPNIKNMDWCKIAQKLREIKKYAV